MYNNDGRSAKIAFHSVIDVPADVEFAPCMWKNMAHEVSSFASISTASFLYNNLYTTRMPAPTVTTMAITALGF